MISWAEVEAVRAEREAAESKEGEDEHAEEGDALEGKDSDQSRLRVSSMSRSLGTEKRGRLECIVKI